jgi:hypothetical protein
MKSLYLKRMLYQQTDEDNPLNARMLCEQLAAYDVPANRKSIHDNVEAASPTTGLTAWRSSRFEFLQTAPVLQFLQSTHATNKPKTRFSSPALFTLRFFRRSAFFPPSTDLYNQ